MEALGLSLLPGFRFYPVAEGHNPVFTAIGAGVEHQIMTAVVDILYLMGIYRFQFAQLVFRDHPVHIGECNAVPPLLSVKYFILPIRSAEKVCMLSVVSATVTLCSPPAVAFAM